MLSLLLHIANSSPIDKELFYAMKTRILQRFARDDGLDLQVLPGKHCWGCDGSGLYYHTYSGDADECYRCGGSGWYRWPTYVTLRRWRLGPRVFHQPIDRCYGTMPIGLVPKVQIEGYVTHRRYSFRAVRWSTLTLGLIFDRRLAGIAAHDIYRRWWIVRLTARRCIDCRRKIWSTIRWRCLLCQRIADRDQELFSGDPPF